MEGQMYEVERQFLFDAVSSVQPRVALEIGTWKGGGSTWQIATALQALRARGHECTFHTCEVDQACFTEASGIYSDRPWSEFVHCHLMPSTQLIEQLISSGVIPDFIFFDGPENAETALHDFQRLDPLLKAGTCFMMHDWFLGTRSDGLRSIKAAELRPYLESLKTWRIVSSLSPPESVGLVLAEKVR